MAHFAEINDQNLVVRVLVLDNSLEDIGQQFLSETLGLGGRWVQTSYNSNFRRRFAEIGMSYDPQLDAFIPEKPFESWILNSDTADWEAPIPKPESGSYSWNEELMQWQAIPTEN